MKTAIWVLGLMGLFAVSCKPKSTDTATLEDLNPCAQDEILASDGSCVARSGEGTDDTGA
ncbi:MAG: hypothetical protein H8D71_02230 [Deltaproteobacteria bacterium]|jgi:hypothetical protein|nr:hypothetical protein [Deltaproteobacteria bacterium]|tara:strand:+ start:346 stop:525 length:180 start_codon:yes stop_codon:yes gene_type:complete